MNRAGKIKTKILIGIVSLFLFLGLLETGLRLAGRIYSERVLPKTELAEGDEDQITILTLGDSYTVGGAVVRQDSYPSILERRLIAEGYDNFRVINGGICEANSTQVLRSLKQHLKNFSPDYVILLVGSVNRFNLYGYDEFEGRRKKLVPRLRVFDMARILITNIRGRLLSLRAGRLWEDEGGEGIIYSVPGTSSETSPDIESDLKDSLIERIKAAPEDYDSYIKLGGYYCGKGEYEKAEAAYREAVSLDFENYLILKRLGKEFLDQGDTDKSRFYLEMAADLHNKDPEVHLLLGHTYAKELHYEGAVKHYRKTIELDPHAISGWQGLGHAYNSLGRHKETISVLQKGLEHNPESPNLRVTLANMYKYDRQYYEAEKLLKESLELNPDQPFALVRLGLCRERFEDSDDAIRHYKMAAEMAPETNSHRAYTELGRIYTVLGQYSNAVKYILKSIQFSPEWQPNYYFLTRAFNLQSRHEAAYIIEFLEERVKEEPALAENVILQNHIDFFRARRRWERKIDQWLRHDLEEIVRICNENNVSIIMKKFPFPYRAANRILEEVAERHAIPFVDHQAVFAKLVKKHSWDDYFADDDHATALGHEVMVDNVFKVLLDEGILASD